MVGQRLIYYVLLGYINSGSGQVAVASESKDNSKENESIVLPAIVVSAFSLPKNDADVASYSSERRLARILQQALDKQSGNASSKFSTRELLACAQLLINDLLDNDQLGIGNVTLLI